MKFTNRPHAQKPLRGSSIFNMIQTLLPKTEFLVRVWGKCLGQNYQNDCGIMSDSHQKVGFDLCFAGRRQYFLETLDLGFLCLNNLCLFGGQICEASIF